jgi:tetratricopeptide (TPR) repeat protein
LGARSSTRSAIFLGTTTGLLAIACHSLTDFNLQIPSNALLATFLAGLLVNLGRFTTRKHGSSGLVVRGVASLWLLTIAAVLASQAWLFWREAMYLREAHRTTLAPEIRLERIEGAIRIQPDNPASHYSMGELLRHESWRGNAGYRLLAEKAIDSFITAHRLNPFDPYALLRRGMCLDHLREHDEAAAFYEESLRLDPHNYYLLAHMGWHLVQRGEYAAAKPWLEKSLDIWHAWHNPIARNYLAIVERELRKQQLAPAGAQGNGESRPR